MPTLYVEKFPEDVYEALRQQARKNRTSISAEATAVLRQFVPTAKELKRRRDSLKRVLALKSLRPPSAGPFPTVEEMVREDRNR